jgi:type IV secretion system protein VirD4
MSYFESEDQRFGSARFAETHDIAAAGMFEATEDSLLVGFHGDYPIYFSGAGGLLMTAGARGGKLASVLGYNLCHGIARTSNFVTLDMKGELAAISQDQTPDGKFCIYWNPTGLHGLAQHRINPVSYIRADSPSLVSDTKVFCENKITASGGANGKYFEGRAREFVEGMVLTITKRDGVLTLPALYEVINFIPIGGDAWLDFAWEMNQSGYPISARIEEEIANAKGQDANAGGFQGILGEIFRAFACLSDPVLMASVSPPYDFSFEELCTSDQRYQVYLCCPAEFAQSWSPVLKSMFVAGMIYKSRQPQAPRQTWILDECAQLGKFPLVTKLFTYGAGIGIRPWAIYQSADQMKLTGENAETIIPSSAALRSYFATRDLRSAEQISRMLGIETLEYDDEERQSQARHARQQALRGMLLGNSGFDAGFEYLHHKRASTRMKSSTRPPISNTSSPMDCPVRSMRIANHISNKNLWMGAIIRTRITRRWIACVL